jgi:hypothetical protein
MKKRKLRENIHYRVRWGNFKSDKWKKKSLLISEINDLIGELYHPSVSRKEIIELKDQLKRSLFSDADEKFKAFTPRQMHDFWDLTLSRWKEKWGDKI